MPNRMPPVHPGEILAQELAELGLSANAFARALAVPANRVTAILKGSRRVTAGMPRIRAATVAAASTAEIGRVRNGVGSPLLSTRPPARG